MLTYIHHHLSIAGVKTMLFDDSAATAIHQRSGGIYRKANHLAGKAMIAAAMKQQKLVSAENVRIAVSEIF